MSLKIFFYFKNLPGKAGKRPLEGNFLSGRCKKLLKQTLQLGLAAFISVLVKPMGINYLLLPPLGQNRE
ncbi:MAG: hypothetical protein HY892_01720 [Deltaproteobacteria bacterium]|nr:hypothetical protein [Deltaproteobacteria bacterium]